MKKIFLILFLLTTNQVMPGHIAGEWLGKTQENNRVNTGLIRFYSESIGYKKGGITFIYPEKYFSLKPLVQITIELDKLKQSSSITINPLIISNNSFGCVVYVSKEIMGLLKNSISEAADDDVIIHLLAFGI